MGKIGGAIVIEMDMPAEAREGVRHRTTPKRDPAKNNLNFVILFLLGTRER
jgi:hypothetical protein